MRIEIDSTKKTIKLLEDISVPDLLLLLTELLGGRSAEYTIKYQEPLVITSPNIGQHTFIDIPINTPEPYRWPCVPDPNNPFQRPYINCGK